MTSMLNMFLTMHDVAELTGIPINTLKMYRQRNKGPESFVLNNRVVYRPEAVTRWIDSQYAATARGGSHQ